MAQLPITRLASEMAARAEPKKKRGILDKVGGFFADAGQEVGRMVTNPIETAQRFGAEAKENFYDPIRNLPNAFDPTVDASAMERVNTGLTGALAVADLVAPVKGAASSVANRYVSKVVAEQAAKNLIDRPSTLNIMGFDVPYGPEAARYAGKLNRYTEAVGTSPGGGVASIGMPQATAQSLADDNVIDPILGGTGLINIMGDRYSDLRNQLESYSNAPVYGYYRDPTDIVSANSYRGGAPFGQAGMPDSVILNVKPDAVKSMSEGDSLMMFSNTKYSPSFLPQILKPYDETLPPPYFDKTIDPDYRELQMRPMQVDKDVSSVTALRGPLPLKSPGRSISRMDHEYMVQTAGLEELRNKLAQSMAARGVPVYGGRVEPLLEILEKDIKTGIYPDELLRQLDLPAFLPDPRPYTQMPPKFIPQFRRSARQSPLVSELETIFSKKRTIPRRAYVEQTDL